MRLIESRYYSLGVNRLVSLDSRSIGPIHRDCVFGKMIFRMPIGDR